MPFNTHTCMNSTVMNTCICVTSWGITMYMNNYQTIITSVHFCETVLKFIVAIATYLCWYLIFIERYSTLPEMYCFAWMLLLLLWLFNWLYTAYVYATHISLFLRRVNLTFVAIFAKCFQHLLEQPMMLLTFVLCCFHLCLQYSLSLLCMYWWLHTM